MPSRFTEQDTEAFYDAEDAIYRSFWDDQGSLHWGYFDASTGLDGEDTPDRDGLVTCHILDSISLEDTKLIRYHCQASDIAHSLGIVVANILYLVSSNVDFLISSNGTLEVRRIN